MATGVRSDRTPPTRRHVASANSPQPTTSPTLLGVAHAVRYRVRSTHPGRHANDVSHAYQVIAILAHVRAGFDSRGASTVDRATEFAWRCAAGQQAAAPERGSLLPSVRRSNNRFEDEPAGG